ncbi:MAG: TetR/AcrR family transcriptional regulator [Anaerolineaceae bacterium]|nr:TetR/AcrR family transcriptional regulator [Anaerolineaceae bacterium]
MARKREFDREQVIERAMLLFWAQGYEATSIRELKAVMEISSSSMYEVFGDKRGVFLAALARFCEIERARIAEMAAQAPTPQQFIVQLFASLEDIVQTQLRTYSGSLVFNTMVEFGTRDADITGLMLAHYLHIAEIITEVLAHAQAAGTIASQDSPLHLAYTILSTLQGVATVKSVKPDFAYVDAITTAAIRLLSL